MISFGMYVLNVCVCVFFSLLGTLLFFPYHRNVLRWNVSFFFIKYNDFEPNEIESETLNTLDMPILMKALLSVFLFVVCEYVTLENTQHFSDRENEKKEKTSEKKK